MWESAGVLAVVAFLWLWFDSLRVREHALALGQRACRGHELQFLDETVECISLRPARNEAGRLVLRRVYRFEFSDDGRQRRAGSIVMLGDELESLTLEPYRLQ